jgi:tRNA(Arg) A34 adenosine deaminase TadA
MSRPADWTRLPALRLGLPPWVRRSIPPSNRVYRTAAERMRLVLDLARLNVEHGTGGPFGAAVFDLGTGRLIAPGVNLVVPRRCSCAHAEIVALSLAQRAIGSHDLAVVGPAGAELVSSTEPCAMCLGAVPWSGVRSLVCAARGRDACRIGFDEGAKPAGWIRALHCRGIRVRRDVCRAEAVAVLRHYTAGGGLIYNPGRPLA